MWGFQADGSVVISVPNASGNPLQWQYTVSPIIVSSNNSQSWASAATVLHNHVYVLGSLSDQAQTLARIRIDALEQSQLEAFEFFYGSEQWAPYNPTRPFAALWSGGDTVPETTLMQHPLLGWYLLYVRFFGNTMLIRYAPSVTGPWSDPVEVFPLPAPYNNGTAGVFCYAVKSHPEWASTNDEIVVSFASNAGWEAVQNDLRLYSVQFVRIQVSNNNLRTNKK